MKRIFTLLFLISLFFSLLGGTRYDTLRTKNIIALNPVHFYAPQYVGVGISYERIINRNIGIKVPIMSALNNKYINAALQLKFYPSPTDRNFAYAISPTFYFGRGSYKQFAFDDFGNETTLIFDQMQVGFLLNQSLEFVVAQHVYIGWEFGPGINYIDQRSGTTRNRITGAFQTNAALGYRF